VVDSGAGQVSLALDFGPGEGRLGDVEHPAVIHTLVPDVASEDHQIGLRVGEGVPVALARCPFADVDDIPNSDSLADV
jgi:hypothetical protein